MNSDFECKKCGDVCAIDGDPPRWTAWCYTCEDYAEGFDASEYEGDRIAGIADNPRE